VKDAIESGSPAAVGWSLDDGSLGRVRLSAQIRTELQSYGNAVIDPREYPRDSVECNKLRSMAAAAGELPPEGRQLDGRPALVQAVNLYEGEDEFAGECRAQPSHPPCLHSCPAAGAASGAGAAPCSACARAVPLCPVQQLCIGRTT
jgi:hypothetical protein